MAEVSLQLSRTSCPPPSLHSVGIENFPKVTVLLECGLELVSSPVSSPVPQKCTKTLSFLQVSTT